MKDELNKLNEVLERIENINNGYFLSDKDIMYYSFAKVHLLSVIENLKLIEK